MENIKKICAVWKYQTLLQVCNNKAFLVLLVLFFYIIGYAEPIVEFASAVNMNINPYLFPLLMNDWVFPIIIALGFLILICDAPFIKRGYLFLIARTGKVCWIVGEFLFLFTYAVLYTLAIYVLTIISTIPRIGFENQWGKVIMTLIRTDASIQFNTIELNQTVAENYSAIEALVKTCILCVLMFWLIGMIVFSLNYIMKNYIGVITGAIIVFLDLAIYNLFDTYALRRFSPISLMKLSILAEQNYQSLTYNYAVCSMIVGSIVIAMVTIVYTKCKQGICLDNNRRER